MGYGYRFGTQIQTYWPDDDDKTMYLSSGFLSMSDLLAHVRDKRGSEVSLDDISVEAENIHTDCLTYDLYDSGDYTQFIVLKYNKQTPNSGNT